MGYDSEQGTRSLVLHTHLCASQLSKLIVIHNYLMEHRARNLDTSLDPARAG